MIPVVRLSFITMKLNKILNTKLTTKALNVSWFLHEGTSWFSNTLSRDNPFSSSLLSSFLRSSSLPLWSIFFSWKKKWYFVLVNLYEGWIDGTVLSKSRWLRLLLNTPRTQMKTYRHVWKSASKWGWWQWSKKDTLFDSCCHLHFTYG